RGIRHVTSAFSLSATSCGSRFGRLRQTRGGRVPADVDEGPAVEKRKGRTGGKTRDGMRRIGNQNRRSPDGGSALSRRCRLSGQHHGWPLKGRVVSPGLPAIFVGQRRFHEWRQRDPVDLPRLFPEKRTRD